MKRNREISLWDKEVWDAAIRWLDSIKKQYYIWRFLKPSFIISFHHKISGSFIFYYIIDIKFHVEIKGETKNHISYLTTIRIWKQHFHFLALKQQVLREETFLVNTPRLFLVIEKKRWKDEFKIIMSVEFRLH